MPDPRTIPIKAVAVPAARRKVLHPDTVRALAADILRNGLRVPITVREDGGRFRLVDGLHRLEAMKWLEHEAIEATVLPAAGKAET